MTAHSPHRMPAAARLLLLLLRLAYTQAVRVDLHPGQSDASVQRFRVRAAIDARRSLRPLTPPSQNALDAASEELSIELYMASDGYIAVRDRPLLVNRSVTIAAHSASPFPPSFDCLGRSSLLVANASHDASSAVSVSGVRVRNGRSKIGGSLRLLAASVRLRDVSISGSTATMGLPSGQDCSISSPPEDCYRGGGAVFVEAGSVSMDGVDVHNASTPLSGGAISILDASVVHLRNVDVSSTHAGAFGGAIAVSSSSRLPHHRFNWTICDVTVADTEAGGNGGAMALSAHGDVRNSHWSVERVSTMRTSSGTSGGSLALVAAKSVLESMWSVAQVDITTTEAGDGRGGGGVALISYRDVTSSVWSVERVIVTDADAGTSSYGGGAVTLGTRSFCTDSSWSVAHVTATNTGGGPDGCGGAAFLYSFNDVINSTWEVTHLIATNTTAGQGFFGGGALALSGHHLKTNSVWSVAHVTATNSRTGRSGGAVACRAQIVESNSSLFVTNVTATRTRAGGSGGAVALTAGSEASNSVWAVTGVTATATTAGEGGGSVALHAARVKAGCTWRVAHVAATSTRAGAFRGGGAVALSANSDVFDSTWSVVGVTVTNATTGDRGGAIALAAYGDVSNSTWVVSQVISTSTVALRNGGAVSLFGGGEVNNCTWSVVNMTASGASAQRGGALALQAPRFVDWMCYLSGLKMSASRATAQGGGVYVSAQSAERSKLVLTDWHASDLSAREGAVGALSHADAASGQSDGLDLAAHRFQVLRATAKQGSGVLAIRAGRPHQIPWRECDAYRQFCHHTPYRSERIPLVYAVRVSASEWHVAGLAATSGAVVAMTNANASFSNMHVRNVETTTIGGLWSLSGYTELAVHNMSATIRRASASVLGLLFEQSQSPGNLTLSNVSARLEDGPLLDTVTQTWIHAGALSPTHLRTVFVHCPMGATFHNASLGRIQLTESPFTVVEETFTPGGFMDIPVSTALEFPYTTTALSCRVCPEGTYLLARLAWVSSDVEGAVCPPDLDANVTMPLCPNAPSSTSSCVKCPRGATCHGGANVTAQFGYACSSPSCQQRFDSCTGSRTGFACGSCPRGFGEVFGSVQCGADAECRDWEHYTAWVAFPPCCIGAAALLLYSADAKSNGMSSGLMTILFVLFQSEAIIRTNDEDKASTLSHLAMFQVSLPAARVCLWRGMSARAKALAPLGSYCGVLGALTLIYGVHWLLYRRSRTAYPPSTRRYRRALVTLLLVSYGAIAGICLKLVTRTEIDGAWYQSLTGERWMHTPDQWVALVWLITSTVPTPLWFWYGLVHLRVGTMSDVTFGLGLLFPIPAALWPRLMLRWPVTWDEKQAARDLHHTLAAPYCDRFWYWDGVFLAQRLVFGLISVSLASDLLYRACAMAVFAVALALMYGHFHVFATPVVNLVHTSAMAGLLAVCFSNGISAYTYQHGIVATQDLVAVGRCSTWMLRAVPVVAIAAMVYQRRKELEGSKDGVWWPFNLPTLWGRRSGTGLSAPLVEFREQ